MRHGEEKNTRNDYWDYLRQREETRDRGIFTFIIGSPH